MGHPVQILNTGGSQLQSGGSLNATLHWDGDSLLFTTDQNGNLTDLKVGLLGDLLPSGGISVLERDWSGDVVAGHNAAGSLGISIEDPYQQSGGFGNENGIPDNVFQQGPILQPASDGIWDGVSVIQGVRNHDPQTGTWTTPDVYRGRVHDPASQKAYMWNRNNPVSYADPSGFILVVTGPQTDLLQATVNKIEGSDTEAGRQLRGLTKVTRFTKSHLADWRRALAANTWTRKSRLIPASVARGRISLVWR